jgi:outer membrane lipoprotein-sorting protein
VARLGWRASVVAAIAYGVVAASAVAQTVPLPKPDPRSKPRSATAGAIQSPPRGAANSAPTSNGFFPFSFSLDKSGAAKAAAFDAKQRALLDKVSGYLAGVQTMVGSFVQVGPDGRRVEGAFYIQKPGKVRFAYNPPSPIDIISDGSTVVVRDRSLDTQDFYPLSQTPLRYLLADHIDLLRDTDVVSISADESFITVVIEETKLVIGTNRLMIMLDAKNLQLKQWTVTDPQGLDTTVAVYNLDSGRKPDPNLFVIDYQPDATSQVPTMPWRR